MARHLSAASAIDRSRLSSSTAWLILLKLEIADPNTRQTVETVHLVANDEDITFDGNLYTAANFVINIDQGQNQAPSVTLVAQDQTGMIERKIEDYAGGVMSQVVMMVVNSDRLEHEPEIENTFDVVSSSAKDGVVSVELGAENPLTIQFPKHTQMKDRCSWRYKGYGCEYAGPMGSCDYTLDGPNGCRAHDNVERFRGLPGLVRMNI